MIKWTFAVRKRKKIEDVAKLSDLNKIDGQGKDGT